LKSNEYGNLIGGRQFEPDEENPMLGFRGASRYYDARFSAAFALECRALARVRDTMGLTNVKVTVPFCRTVEEARRVAAELAAHGLRRGERGLALYVMCEVPSNVIEAEAFAEIFDGFSIGSNDLTQLVLGVDRDSEIVAHLSDERHPAVRAMIRQVIRAVRAAGRTIGLCGQAPSDYPEFARFLVEEGIDRISLNPDAVLRTTALVLEAEAERAAAPPARTSGGLHSAYNVGGRGSSGEHGGASRSTPRLRGVERTGKSAQSARPVLLRDCQYHRPVDGAPGMGSSQPQARQAPRPARGASV